MAWREDRKICDERCVVRNMRARLLDHRLCVARAKYLQWMRQWMVATDGGESVLILTGLTKMISEFDGTPYTSIHPIEPIPVGRSVAAASPSYFRSSEEPNHDRCNKSNIHGTHQVGPAKGILISHHRVARYDSSCRHGDDIIGFCGLTLLPLYFPFFS
jgi:hypothetical protein